MTCQSCRTALHMVPCALLVLPRNPKRKLQLGKEGSVFLRCAKSARLLWPVTAVGVTYGR